MTAPMTALMIAATIPLPITTPSRGSRKPAMNAPTIPDHDIADEAEAVTFHDQAGEPAGNGADDQPYDQTFDWHIVSSPRARATAMVLPCRAGTLCPSGVGVMTTPLGYLGTAVSRRPCRAAA